MSVQISSVFTGTTANDGTGDTIQAAFIKVNSSMSNVASAINTVQSSFASNLSIAALTLSSTIQFANLTTSQVNSISSPAPGMAVYNYTSGNIQVYNGTKWANVVLS
jgi:hypothetical protein